MGKSKREPASLKKKITLHCPVQMKEGEFLTDVTHKKWKVGKPIGVGGFGEIYLVSDDIVKPVPHDALYAAKIEPHKSGPLFVEMNFYLRVAKEELINKWKKDRGLKHLGMPHYITFGSHFYQNEKFRFLVLQRFGQDLGKLFNKYKKKFHLKTVLTLGVQILDILEYIHSHGYIHADIKDSNLLLASENNDNIYLLDYGLACRYIDSSGVHKEYNPDQRKAHDGTIQYTSRDAHVGAHSRRSDLEVLAYNMVHWLSGSLPWEDNLTDPEKVAQEKENYMKNIPTFLKKCFGDNPPVVLSHFLKYVVSLSFETKPDYDYCKTLLRHGIRQAGYADDGKLNLDSPPAKLKSRKRIRNCDIENLVELKPVKIHRSASRQPCVPVQANYNRMTRQQTAANTLALRSRETFDWVKVLQSDPEKLLKSQNISNDPLKNRKIRKQEEKSKYTAVEINLRKENENPLDNPTPAILEVLRLRNSLNINVGKRPRSESHCSSPVFYDNSTLTPAMEEIIRRREINSRKNQESGTKIIPIFTASVTRSNRLKNKAEVNTEKIDPDSVINVTKIKRITRKTSAPETKTPEIIELRKRTRKYSLQEHKLVTDLNLNAVDKKSDQTEIPATKRSIRKCRRGLLPLSKSHNKKGLCVSRKEKIRRREVSPSEVDFVPRLRSGTDNSDDYNLERMVSMRKNTKIRNYAANSTSSPTRRRRCGINYSGLPPNARDTSIIL